jgi:hypothetical protein
MRWIMDTLSETWLARFNVADDVGHRSASDSAALNKQRRIDC